MAYFRRLSGVISSKNELTSSKFEQIVCSGIDILRLRKRCQGYRFFLFVIGQNLVDGGQKLTDVVWLGVVWV
jgi:hypothetical protein